MGHRAGPRRRVVRVPQVILDASPPPWELRKEALAAGGAAAAGPPPRALPRNRRHARTARRQQERHRARRRDRRNTPTAQRQRGRRRARACLGIDSTRSCRGAGGTCALHQAAAAESSARQRRARDAHARACRAARSRKRGRALSETPRGHGTSWGSVAAALLPQRAQTSRALQKSILRLEAANDAVQREGAAAERGGPARSAIVPVHHLARLLALLDEYSDARWHELGRRAVAERDDDDGDGGHAMAQLVEADDATRTRAAAIEGELWARATAGASGAGAAAEEAAASGDAQPRDVIDTYRRLVEEKIEREMERAARELLPVHAQLQDGWRTPPPPRRHSRAGSASLPSTPSKVTRARHRLQRRPTAEASPHGVSRRASRESSPPLPAPPLALPYGPSPPLFSQAMLPPAMPTLTDIHASLSTLPMSVLRRSRPALPQACRRLDRRRCPRRPRRSRIQSKGSGSPTPATRCR